MKARTRQSVARGKAKRAATLLEVLVALGIGLVFLALTFSVVALALRMVHKNMELSDATSSTRKVQEYLTREISQAIAIPNFINESAADSNKYSEIRYRILIGPPAKIPTSTATTSTSLVLNCPADLKPISGDFILLSSPDLGEGGARIVTVSDGRVAGTSGNVTLTFSGTIASLTSESLSEVKSGTTATIQRERAFVVPAPTVVDGVASPVTSLVWLPTTGNYGLAADGVTMELKTTEGVVLSSRINSNERFLFSRDPAEPFATEEASLLWRIDYLSEKNSGVLGGLLGGSKTAYLSNSSEGRIIPKSFNPLGTGGIIPPPTTIKTTSTTTSTTSTSTTSTSSTSKTTTTTSTTSKTTSTTSTSKSTTKTTSTTSTSKSTTKTTSTTSTSKSTTKTTSTSSTSKSTTKTTTSKTTSTTTSKTTSTSSTTSIPTTSTTTSKTTTSTSSTSKKPSTTMVDG